MIPRRQLLIGPAAGLLSACRWSNRRLIGVVPKATSHLFFVSVKAGVDQAAREFHVDVLWNGPNDETDHIRQIQIVDAMVARRVNGLAISATDDRALVAPLERATQAGIPITVFDSGVNIENYVSFVATDNHGAGCTAARLLAELVGGSGKLGMIMQKPGGRSTGLREQGFEATIGREFPGLNIAGRQYGMADPAKSRAAAENILSAHPDLAGLFASSEAASLGSILAIRSRGLSGRVKLVTFDTSQTHVEALADGTADVMLVQDSFRTGFEAVKSLADHLAGRPVVRRLDLPPHVIRKAGLEKPEVRRLLFPDWMKQPPGG